MASFVFLPSNLGASSILQPNVTSTNAFLLKEIPLSLLEINLNSFSFWRWKDSDYEENNTEWKECDFEI